MAIDLPSRVFTLPPFVTAAAVEQLLSWAASLRREIRATAQKMPRGGWSLSASEAALYHDIVALLAQPGGVKHFEAIVARADRAKGRGLVRALHRAISPDLASLPPSDFPSLASLAIQALQADLPNEVAWLGFAYLGSLDVGRTSELADDPVLRLIEGDAGLQDRLGAYWREFKVLSTQPPQIDATAWADEIKALATFMQSAPAFDPQMPGQLSMAAQRLEQLIAAQSERAVAIARGLREQAVADMNAACEALAAMPHAPAAAAVEAAHRAAAEGRSDAVHEVTDWARRTAARLADAQRRCEEAQAREAADGSDDAIEASAAAKKARNAVAKTAREEIERHVLAAPLPTPAIPPAMRRPAITLVDAEDGMPGQGFAEAPSGFTGQPISLSIARAAIIEPEAPKPTDWAPYSEAAAPPQEARDAERLTNEALLAGRYGLAAHLAAAAAALGAPEVAGGAATLRALAAGTAVSDARVGRAAALYSELEPQLHAAIERWTGRDEVFKLIILAGAIRPALFSSQTGASEILRAAELGVFGADLHALVVFIADELPGRGGHIELNALAPAADELAQRGHAEALRKELLALVDAAPSRGAVFHRAKDIMGRALSATTVATALAAARHGGGMAGNLADAAALWLDADLEGRVKELDDEERRARRGERLEGLAKRQLMGRLREVADLLRRWGSAERAALGPRNAHFAETRGMLRTLCIRAADTLALPASATPAKIPAIVADRALRSVIALLEGRPDPEQAASGLGVDMLLEDDLLLFAPYPAATLDGWTAPAAKTVIGQAAAMLAAPADFRAAFARLLKEARFHEAARAARRLVSEGETAEDLDQELAAQRERRCSEMQRAITMMRRRLDDLLGADAQGQVDPAALLQLDGMAAALAGDPATIDFPPVVQQLGDVEQMLADAANLLVEPLRREIDQLECTGQDVGVLRAMADRGDLTTLREHLEAARSGAHTGLFGLADRRLVEFAKRFLNPVYERTAVSPRAMALLVIAARNREATEAVDFSELPEEDVASAEELLTAWKNLKLEPETALRALLTALRFTSVKLTPRPRLQPALRFSVTADPITDRRECPVPSFGSAARGRYEVILIASADVRRGDELHKLVTRLDAPTTTPTLIVVNGAPLSLARRREFMVEIRRRGSHEPCALLDEAAVLFLASQPRRGLSDFFAVTLPMGAVQPYSDAGGKTSPEMFFGRKTELSELWKLDGSCLVYGGRQLGKTALLEQIRLRHHSPPAQVVLMGSLQGRADIWTWLHDRLKEGGIPAKSTSDAGLAAAVRDWLATDFARRIVILVDEADFFLEAEMRGRYKSLLLIRDLMQDTGRRCKFVFAGLHDVQRLARTVNPPLLHFGAALRVGPLFGPDLGEARAMVEQPMAAAGFIFENAALAGRVLSEVGYYPSLVQTFGKRLIDRLNLAADRLMPVAAPLPIVVNEAHIDETLNDPVFRQDIGHKFENTLNLDERYRLITYAMLVHGFERRNAGATVAILTDAEVQALAIRWWPQGFAEARSLDAFQGLLQEMVGLGVLIETGAGYVIRSSRIAAMLGGTEQVERKLIELSQSPGLKALDTGALRRLETGTHLPYPLTARQEGMLLGEPGAAVQLVLGSKALGLDELPASLAELSSSSLVVEDRKYAGPRQAMQILDEIAARAPVARPGLLVLSGPWLDRAVLDGVRAHDALGKRGRAPRCRLLLVPFAVDWAQADAADGPSRLWGIDLLSLLPLGDSGLRQWLRAVTGAETADAVQRLRELTGGFGMFLRGLKGRTPDELVAAAEAAQPGWIASAGTPAALGLQDARLLQTARLLLDIAHEGEETNELLELEGIANPAAAAAHLQRLGILELGVGLGRVLNPFAARLLATRAA